MIANEERLFDAVDLADLRRRVVEVWSGRVAIAEMARRLNITPAQLENTYALELADSAKKWTADALIALSKSANDGDADAALLCLALNGFDTQPMAGMLAVPGGMH